MITAREHRVQIERIIRRSETKASAEFLAGPWFCCEAWLNVDGTGAFIMSRSTAMTPEQASTVQIALGMAIDWIAGETLAQGAGQRAAAGKTEDVS